MLVACKALSTENDLGYLHQLWQGQNATINFQIEYPPGATSDPSFLMYYDSISRPFVKNNQLLSEGLKHESQLDRFNISSSISQNTLSVNLTISSVILYDEGVFVIKLTMFESDFFFQETLSKSVTVRVPPGKARCYITESQFKHLKNIKCHATCGNGKTDLVCYQEKQKIPFKGEIVQDRVAIRAVFWMDPYSPVCCCSSDVSQNVSHDSCKDYEWAPIIRGNSPRGSQNPSSTYTSKTPEDTFLVDMTSPPLESCSTVLFQCHVFVLFATSLLLQLIIH